MLSSVCKVLVMPRSVGLSSRGAPQQTQTRALNKDTREKRKIRANRGNQRISTILQLGTIGGTRRRSGWNDHLAQRAPVIRPSVVDPSIPEDPIVERWRQQVAAAKMASVVWEVYHEIRMDAFRGDTELYNLIIARAGHSQPEGIYKMVVSMLSRNIQPNERTVMYAFKILRQAHRYEDVLNLNKLITHVNVSHTASSLLHTVVATVDQSGPEAAAQFIHDRLNTWPNGSKLFVHINAVLYAIKSLDHKDPELLNKRIELAERALRHFLTHRPEGQPLAHNTDILTQELIKHRPELVWTLWETLYDSEKNLVGHKTLGKLAIYAIEVKKDINAAKKMLECGLGAKEPTADLLCCGLVALSHGSDTAAFESFWSKYPYFEKRMFNARVYAVALEHYALNVNEASLANAIALESNIPEHRRTDLSLIAFASVYIAHDRVDDAFDIINSKLTEPLAPAQWSRWLDLVIRQKHSSAVVRIMDAAFGVLRFSSELLDTLVQTFVDSSDFDAIKERVEAHKRLPEECSIPYSRFGELSLEDLPVSWNPTEVKTASAVISSATE